MRHRLSRLRLRQKPAHSRLLQRNLVTSLFLYESIRTTKKRAEVIRPIVDRLITTAKTKEPMSAIRSLNQVLTHKNASRKAMEVFKDRYKARTSGFTRMVPLGSRRGDGAELVTLMLMDAEVVAAPEAKAKKSVTSAKKTTSAKSTTKTKSVKKVSAESTDSPASSDSSES